MAFQKGEPRPENAGRKKGSKNKVTDAQADLLRAWDVTTSFETVKKMVRAAIDDAIGVEVTVRRKDGSTYTFVKRDFEPIKGILPYIARKMPVSAELSGLDGQPIHIKLDLGSD